MKQVMQGGCYSVGDDVDWICLPPSRILAYFRGRGSKGK